MEFPEGTMSSKIPGFSAGVVLDKGHHRIILMGEQHRHVFSDMTTRMPRCFIDYVVQAAKALPETTFEVFMESSPFILEMQGQHTTKNVACEESKHRGSSNDDEEASPSNPPEAPIPQGLNQIDAGHHALMEANFGLIENSFGPFGELAKEMAAVYHGIYDDDIRAKEPPPRNMEFHSVDVRGEYKMDPRGTAAWYREHRLLPRASDAMLELWRNWEAMIHDIGFLQDFTPCGLEDPEIWWSLALDMEVVSRIDVRTPPTAKAPCVTVGVFGVQHVISIAWMLQKLGFSIVDATQRQTMKDISLPFMTPLPKNAWVPGTDVKLNFLGSCEPLDMSPKVLTQERGVLENREGLLPQKADAFVVSPKASHSFRVPLNPDGTTTRKIFILSLPEKPVPWMCLMNSNSLFSRYASLLYSPHTPTIALLGTPLHKVLDESRIPLRAFACQDAATDGVLTERATDLNHRLIPYGQFPRKILDQMKALQGPCPEYLTLFLKATKECKADIPSTMAAVFLQFVKYFVNIEASQAYDDSVPIVVVTTATIMDSVLGDMLLGLCDSWFGGKAMPWGDTSEEFSAVSVVEKFT